jgi:hypothetical protein
MPTTIQIRRILVGTSAIPSNVLTINGQPITIGGQYLTIGG